jgi:tetratricopeptide (TPR) repeat protein
MKKIILLSLLILACTASLQAQKRTFTRDYTYQVGEADSKLTARANAIIQMRNILLREVGEFLHTERTFTQNATSQDYAEKIEAITAGIVEMKTLDERWDGVTYYIKAEMTVDPKDLERRIAEVLNDKQKTRELEEARKRTLAAEAEAARLRKELEKTKSEQQRLALKTKYQDALSAEEYLTKGYTAYAEDDYEKALEYMEKALNLGYKQDGELHYYCAIISRLIGDYEKTLKYMKKALNLGYEADGDLYAAYAEVLQATEDTVTSIQVLTKGSARYPSNQSIIIGLINTFLQQGDDPKKILPYIEQAQQNDPNNASLYYAEGVVYEQIEDFDNAILAYKQSLKKDKNNFYSNYSLGAIYFNKAVQIQNIAAIEPDDNKYAKMSKEIDMYFDLSLPYLERAYELDDSQEAVLESLKSLYFRLREKSSKMQKKYEYFNSKLQEMQHN